MKADLFSYDLEELVLGQESLTTLPNVFFRVVFSFTHSLINSLTYSLGELEFITISHCMYLVLLSW